MNNSSVSLIAKIRECANRLILAELKTAGYTDLAPSHGDILAVLLKSNGIKMQDIAKKIHRTKATTTVLVDKLEQAGFVKREKSGSDSRYTNVYLTDDGAKFRKVFEHISNILNATAFKGFSEAEAAMLEELLKRMLKNLE